MDPRSPYLHHTRYVHTRPPPPPPQPSSFPDNLNFFGRHHSNLLAPPPLRPPAPPPSYRPVPAPPPFNPQNTHFIYNPIYDNYPPRSHPDLTNFPQSPRILHPRPYEDGLPRRLHYVRESGDSPRVLSDNWPPRSHPAVNLDPESYRRQLDDRHMSPVGNIGHELKGNSRFIEERSVGIDHKSREELVFGRDQFGSSSDISSRDFRMLLNHTRVFKSNSGNSDSRPDHDRANENQRLVCDREVMRDARNLIGMENNEIGDSNGIRVNGKREHYRIRDPNVEFERHNGKGSREGSHEFNRTPRKQIQKRSAFLRIQKPYWNREDERVHYSGYFDDTKSSSFRSKDQSSHSDHRIGEEVREGSPVELDVSFKSNSLVAKAIVMPSSSSPDVYDTKFTPRNSKIRKVLIPDKDSSSSSLAKPNEGSVKSDNSVHVSKNASNSLKDIKQSSSVNGLQESKEKITASGIDNVPDGISLPGSRGTNVSVGKSRMEKPGSRTNALPGRMSIRKVEVKKKIVKRAVKKATNPSLSLSSLQSRKKCNEPAKPENFHGLHVSSEADKSAIMASADIVDSHSCPTEVTVKSENEKVDGFANATISEELRTGGDSGSLCVPNINRKRSQSTSPIDFSIHEETTFDDSSVNGISANDLQAILNTDKNFTRSLNETTSPDIGSVGKQFCQNGETSFSENNALRGSAKVLLSVEGNAEVNKICEGPINSGNTTMSFNDSLINLHEGSTAFDIGTTTVCKQPCTTQVSQSVENVIADRFPNDSCTVRSSKKFCLSSSGETGIESDAVLADCSNHGVGAMMVSVNDCTNSEEINLYTHGAADGMGKQQFSDWGTILHGSVSIGESLTTMVSIDGNEDSTPNIKKSKEFGIPQSGFPRSEVTDMYVEPTDMVGCAPWVDTTLRLSFKDPSPTESTVSGDGFMHLGLQSCTDGIIVFHQSNYINDAEAKVLVSSSDNVAPEGTLTRDEKRKFSASQPGFSCSISSDINEEPVPVGICTPGISNSDDGLTQPEDELAVSGMVPMCVSDLPSLQKGITALPESDLAGGLASIRDTFEDEGLKGVHSCSATEQLVLPKGQFLCPLELEGEQIANENPVVAGSRHQTDSMDMGSGEEEKMDVDTAEEQQVVIDTGIVQCQMPSELDSPGLDGKVSSTDFENYSYHDMKNDSVSVTNYQSSFGDVNGVPTTNSGNEFMEFVLDTPSNVGSPETFPDATGTSLSQISIDRFCGDGEILVEKPAIQVGSDSSAGILHSQNAKIILKSDCAELDHSYAAKTDPFPLKDSQNTTHTLKSQPTLSVSRVYTSRSPFIFAASKSTASSSQKKTRTWHRADKPSASALPGNKAISSTFPTQRQLPKNVTGFQSNSYIRKGNSLVRKPSPVAAQSQSHGFSSSVYRLNSIGTCEMKKNSASESRIDVVDPPKFVRTEEMNAAFERPKTPPLSSVPKIQNHTTNSLRDGTSSPPAESLHISSTETASHPVKHTESNDVPETPVIQTGQINNFVCHIDLNNENAVSSNVKSVTYVKRKSNQLVATSNPCALSTNIVHNSPPLSSDGYYKRRKNQLIRTSLESHVNQTVSVPDERLNSEEQIGLNLVSRRSFSKRRIGKVVRKTCKPSKFSLVWTMCGAQLPKNDCNSLPREKILPYLFPWKRATYWRSFVPNSASCSSNSSLSPISRKLLLLRKRDTIYTRSKNGFSLRKSKVLSVGGSSLKWSKSIERHSRKANEEATLAVAAAQRMKREQNGIAHIVSGTKNGNNSSRERVFRIGSVRYKMDSSRRTLQRILVDESSCAAALQTEKDAKKSYVPRRLVIGKDEYVRIGNGNQLVRDPKKRTRILASEKVRWSLHTARSRLAKKRKYCQFFTRFGKCNKDDGKCPYIHDPSKIAVCTKFLNGLCSKSDCKLTHKVIPERMPDCCYFLQGLCTNKNCPYRHVHVNPNAFTCEAFLRGYCADGNECRKKHTYVCHIYELTGSCPQGSKCKLHHPKSRSKSKKSNQSRQKRNAQRRYFGSMHINVSEPGTAVSEKHSAAENDENFFEGIIADYISLDVRDEEAGENNNPMDGQITFNDSDIVDLEFGDLDEQIKPIRIMNISTT